MNNGWLLGEIGGKQLNFQLIKVAMELGSMAEHRPMNQKVRFDSRLGHMAGLRAQPPIGDMQEGADQ